VGQVGADDGLLVRTNHFLSAEGEPGCQGARIDHNSWVRRDHLVATLGEQAPSSADDVCAAMRHHTDEGSVCRHPEEDVDPAEQTSTLATVSLDVASGSLTAWDGGPCSITA
jgi:isopenicillin-N N-acyltransferase like protein